MAQYTHEYEKRRLVEPGITPKAAKDSMQINLWSIVAERTESVNPFTLKANVETKKVSATGFDHREGDLSQTYELSVIEAQKRKQLEADRFQLENDGYEKAKEKFFQVPLYSTVVLSSPPPSIPIEGYKGHNCTYFYFIMPGDRPSERTIKSLTWMNKLSLEEQKEILNMFSLEKNIQPTEQSILLSPVVVRSSSSEIQTETVKTIWSEIERVYYRKQHRNFLCPPVQVIEEYLLHGNEKRKHDHQDLDIMIDGLASVISHGADINDFREQWAIMLNLADKELLHRDVTQNHLQKEYLWTVPAQPISPSTIFDYYRHLNYQPRVVDTPCGSSGELSSENRLDFERDRLIETRTFKVAKADALDSSDNGWHSGECCHCRQEKRIRCGWCEDCAIKVYGSSVA